MFGDIGAPELIIILVIVLVLFGAGRVGRVGKDLGTSIKEFRKAMNDDDAPAGSNPAASMSLPPGADTPPSPGNITPAAAPRSGSDERRPPALF